MSKTRLIILGIACLLIPLVASFSPARAQEKSHPLPAKDRMDWWDALYLQREAITVANSSAGPMPSGYSVSILFNHKRWVRGNNSLDNGNDIRIVFFNGLTHTQVSRILESGSAWNSPRTRIWFRTQSGIGPKTKDQRYYLYYNNLMAGAPPQSPDDVFEFSDTFDSGLSDDKWQVTTGKCDFAAGLGAVHLYTAEYRGTTGLASRRSFDLTNTLIDIRIQSEPAQYRALWCTFGPVIHHLGTTNHQWEQFLHNLTYGANGHLGRIIIRELGWFNLATAIGPERITGAMSGETLSITNTNGAKPLTGTITINSCDDYGRNGFWLDQVIIRKYIEPEPDAFINLPLDEEREIKQLISELGHDSWRLRETATAGLIELGPVAVPYLKTALASPDAEVRMRARFILQQLGVAVGPEGK